MTSENEKHGYGPQDVDLFETIHERNGQGPNVATHRCRANRVEFETEASSLHSVRSLDRPQIISLKNACQLIVRVLAKQGWEKAINKFRDALLIVN